MPARPLLPSTFSTSHSTVSQASVTWSTSPSLKGPRTGMVMVYLPLEPKRPRTSW